MPSSDWDDPLTGKILTALKWPMVVKKDAPEMAAGFDR